MIPGINRDVLKEIKAFTEHTHDEFELTNEQKNVLKIKSALSRYAGIDKCLVDVFVYDDGVVLNGMVNTLSQKEDAESIVFMVMPGIARVDNNLSVNIEYAGTEVFEF